MPKVGQKRFPYTERGMQEALEYAKKTGQRLQVERTRQNKRKTRSKK